VSDLENVAVVARSFEQFNHWAEEERAARGGTYRRSSCVLEQSGRRYFYVRRPSDLWGMRIVDVVAVGDYWRREDAVDIGREIERAKLRTS
jgi:hypothetical protein